MTPVGQGTGLNWGRINSLAPNTGGCRQDRSAGASPGWPCTKEPPRTVHATQCLQRKGWSWCDRTGTEARRDFGAVLAREVGSAGLPIPEVPCFPSEQCQPRRITGSSPALPSTVTAHYPRAAAQLLKVYTPAHALPPLACLPLSRTSKPCWKSPLICPACTATLPSSPEPRSNLPDLFAAPSCGEGSSSCLAPSHPLCPASRGTLLSQAHPAGGCCHVSCGRKAHLIPALGRERLRECAGGVSRVAAGNRPCWEAQVTARRGGEKGQGETVTRWKPVLQGTRCPSKGGTAAEERQRWDERAAEPPMQGAWALCGDPLPMVQLSGGWAPLDGSS